MDFDFEIRKLSSKFFLDYPSSKFPDILRKQDRPYAALIISLNDNDDSFVCVPFRSNITHEFAFKFQNSFRSRSCSSGLDYTKICIIKNLDYIEDVTAIVDQDEYNEMRINIQQIVSQVYEYINDYVQHVKKISLISKRTFRKKYWYSSLKYFHKELGI